MLIDAIGDLLPLAVAVALSPIPIVAVVLVLASRRARSNGPLFAVGWIVGLALVSVVVVAVLDPGVDEVSSTSTLVDVVRVAGGLALLAMGLRQWSKRPRADDEPVTPTWTSTIDTASPGRAFVLGTALSGANPKNLILTIAAGATIAQANLSTRDAALAVTVFVAIGSISVIGAVVAFVVAPQRTAAPLSSIKDFMIRNNAVIMMVVLLVIGANVLGNGLSGLFD